MAVMEKHLADRVAAIFCDLGGDDVLPYEPGAEHVLVRVMRACEEVARLYEAMARDTGIILQPLGVYQAIQAVKPGLVTLCTFEARWGRVDEADAVLWLQAALQERLRGLEGNIGWIEVRVVCRH